MGLSTLEKQRLANIARNKEILKKLNLDGIADEIHELASPVPKKRKVAKPKEVVEPLRKSRRLQGIKIEDTEEYQKAIQLEEIRQAENERLEKLKSMKLPGDVSLLDMIKQEQVENGEVEQDENKLLQSLAKLSDNFSVGDFYETVSKHKTNDASIDKLREEFRLLSVYEKYQVNDLQLTYDRMSMVQFHPSVSEKVIIGGDILGNLGIWNPSGDTDEEPAITVFSLHGKTISKIAFEPRNLTKVYTSSYDNSIRVTDLKTLKSSEILGLLDDNGHDIGVSDIQISTQTNVEYSNLIFFTTLSGQFGLFDIRTKPKPLGTTLFRLSDKKIGGFSINPNANYQISTASLDRTLKIWDLRKTYPNSKWSDKFPEEACLHSYGSFGSRLSVSISDWNSSGDIVGNGYADTINIFNLGDTSSWDADFLYKVKKKQTGIPDTFKPNHTLKHNCRTGKWVSILKARWQSNPKDGYEKFVIGNMKKFFDVYTNSGIQIAHLRHSTMTAVPAVSSFHPTENWLVGGTASGKCVLFTNDS